MKTHYIKRETSFLSYFQLKQTILCWSPCLSPPNRPRCIFDLALPAAAPEQASPYRLYLQFFGWPRPAGGMSSQIGEQKTPGYSPPGPSLVSAAAVSNHSPSPGGPPCVSAALTGSPHHFLLLTLQP